MQKTLAGLIIVGLISIGFVYLREPARISTVIAPHHDLVADYREKMFADLGRSHDFDKIILLSPDHYNIEDGTILTYADDFTTRFGEVSVSQELVDMALKYGAEYGNTTFESEHGIKTILPDLTRHFPDSEIVPITIKQSIDQQKLDSFIENLYNDCGDCVMIASIDFSHYQPYAISELHDELSLRAVRTQDMTLASETAEVGPPHILRSAIYWSQLQETNHFELAFRTNSTEISGDFYEEGTTHIAGWYEEGEQVPHPDSVTFTFAGDIMFDRGVADIIERVGEEEFLSLLGDRVLWGTDIVMANLEGPITSRQTLPPDINKAPRFSFDPNIIAQLEFLHINALNTQTNHLLDAGQDGADDTERILQANDIVPQANDPTVFKGNGLSTVLFSVDVVGLQSLNESDLAPYLDDEQHRVVVYAHWGPEGESDASRTQSDLAKQWIDWGADLVVGTGTHTIQGGEVYNQRPIFYSLGNFIFDMQTVAGGSQGLLVAGEFYDGGVRVVASIIDGEKVRPILGRSAEYDSSIRGHLNEIDEFVIDDRGGVIYEFPID